MYFDNLTVVGVTATLAVVGLIVHLMLRGDCRRGDCDER